MIDCQLEEEPGRGRCCCNCQHQMLAMKHPWNAGAAKGRITEIFGALCAAPDIGASDGGKRRAVFFDAGHGMCEMHDFVTANVLVSGLP